MNSVTVKAFGKVNLGLDVTGRRADGYHLVKMVMQTVDIFDEVTISRSQDHAGKITVSCDVPGVPQDESNLAYKAAAKICRERQIDDTLHIHISKNIPVAAGMAGGSADAAAVIDAMNRLYNLGMEQEEKDRLAVSLGADVPFCLRRGTYLSEGIGEQLSKLEDLAHCYMVIIKPDFSVSTAWAYHALDEYMDGLSDGGSDVHPDINRLTEALSQKDIKAIACSMENILELPVMAEHEEIGRIKEKLIEDGALTAVMSGSGPTVFGIFTDKEKADKAFVDFKEGKYGKFEIEF